MEKIEKVGQNDILKIANEIFIPSRARLTAITSAESKIAGKAFEDILGK